MKKLLLSSAAICGLAMVAAPAQAQVQLEIGGFFKGYGAYIDQDEQHDDPSTVANESQTVNNFDIIRHTEVHFGGETTLDNGLTVGFHTEGEADGGDGFEIEESYAYFSGSWGRVNLGAEDGAAYLLQVAAPSADSNIDGIRQFVNPINWGALTANSASGTDVAGLAAVLVGGAGAQFALDYEQNATGYNDKITYLTPIMNGFQGGLSYTPDNGYADDFEGVGLDDVTDAFGEGYDAALRYEGQFNNVGIIAGAGYTHIELERAGTTIPRLNDGAPALVAIGDATDDREVWNAGLDLDIGPFGVGAIYKSDNNGNRTQDVAVAGVRNAITGADEETYVIGADYTTGPFKFGVSYLDQENTFGIDGLDTDRYSGGVTYTYGPGMTLRGSVGHVELEGTGIGGYTNAGSTPAGLENSVDATYVTVGTQINF